MLHEVCQVEEDFAAHYGTDWQIQLSSRLIESTRCTRELSTKCTNASLSAILTSSEIIWETRLHRPSTIHAGQGIHNCLNTQEKRQSAQRVVNQIARLYRDIGANEFEEDEEVDELLAKARELTEEVEGSYSQRSVRRR